MSDGRDRKTLRALLPFLGIAVGVAGIGFVVRTVVTRRSEVADAFSGADPTPLVLSILLGAAAMTLIGALWVGMLQSRGHHAPRTRAMAWYFVGQLGKYVPGGIWPVVGRAEMAVRGGIPRADAYRATGLSLVTTYAAAIVAAGIGGLLTPGRTLVGLLVCALCGTGWVVWARPGVSATAAKVGSRLGRPNLELPPRSRLVWLVALHVPSWVLMSLSTSVTARAFDAHIGAGEMLFVTSLSWFVGFVVPGVPGGIGVRESVFTALAGPTVGSGVAVSLALASRVVFVVVDILGALVSSAVAGGRRLTSAER